MEASPDDLECGGDGDDDVEERRTDDPSRGLADDPDDDPDDAPSDERDDEDEESPPESPKEGAVDSERDDEEGTTASGPPRASASLETAKGKCCAATAMVLVVWGVAIALLSVTLGLGPGRLSPSNEEGLLCTLCGEDGLGLSEIDEATAFPTRRPSAAAPDHGTSIIFAL